MTPTAPLHLGIDLGTSNSSAAVFDGEHLTLVSNNQGSPLTPSVVRIDSRGIVTVGARARRFLETDPENTRAEFKRLMGSEQAIEFPAARLRRRPEELAAEILKSLRADVRDQFGMAPRNAVVCVPALFELPQAEATSRAAHSAGFEHVELLQEPVASALAAGWNGQSSDGKWLVFDLGAGTFDVSLLETRDGMLRVVGHDGDNFLGGRDLDWAIVDWALAEIARASGVPLSRADPAHAAGVRKLKLAAEEAKIELSRAAEAAIALPALFVAGGKDLDADLVLARADLERLAIPLVDRAVAICRRLLSAQRVEPGQVARVVLVGGPTAMPLVRARVADGLGAPLAEGHDPMTLVVQGAALYAASAGLDARPAQTREARAHGLVLKFAAVSTDLTPYVVGRVVDSPGATGPAPEAIRLVRADGWSSTPADVGKDGSFTLTVELVPRKTNVFAVAATTRAGAGVPVHPASLTIVQGVTITDPPLSRSIGVALANDLVRIFFERGAPLPARRTFVLHTVEGVARGCKESLLRVPIVQGEFEIAHLCRLVGSLEIAGSEAQASLPAGSAVELTLEVDRGGKLAARAFVPALSQIFEGVAHVAIPTADPATLVAAAETTGGRVEEAFADAVRRGDALSTERLEEVRKAMAGLPADLAAAQGGDADAAQKARRTLLEADATLEEVQAEKRWPELDHLAKHRLLWTSSWVEGYGTPVEKAMLREVQEAVHRARTYRETQELERQLRLALQLGNTAFYRAPNAWNMMFDDAAAGIDGASDLPRAQKLVKDGEKAKAKKDTESLRNITRELWGLMPPDAQERRLGFDSGVW